MNTKNWYELDDVGAIDSPALLVFRDRVQHNIDTAIRMVNGNLDRLQPHVKTCKSKEAIYMMMASGIYKFKCATISEAEILGICGVKEVLIAYQVIGPKLHRLVKLIHKYPETTFSILTDNISSATEQGGVFKDFGLKANVYIDINVGMNRTGISIGSDALDLYRYCNQSPNIILQGLHVYDGHIRLKNYDEKQRAVQNAFSPIDYFIDLLSQQGFPKPKVICGGSPSFSVHALRQDVVCSPGTFIYWDHGYAIICPEQEFLPAIVILSRIISKPSPDLICIDAGHKAMASENPIGNRIHFLNQNDLVPKGQSEEHLVLSTPANSSLTVGELLYAIPFHVCPTVNLYYHLMVIVDGKITGTWKNIARDRQLEF